MKIKTKKLSYDEVIKIKKEKHKKPIKQSPFLRLLMKIVSLPDLISVGFKCEKQGMERLGKNECALFLMNHSCFIDLKIASSLLFPRRYSIICTSDGFVGKESLMRSLGCIPTEKFLFDISLVLDIKHAVNKLGSSILMYPEASYSFDGCATPLPESIGQLVKALKIPVVMIKTHGAFARQPLYNGLRTRRVKVGATMRYLLSPDDIENMSHKEINEIINKEFEFDNFKYQQENNIVIDDSERAVGLERVLYKCPHCQTEGKTQGVGTELICHACGRSYTLDKHGYIVSNDGESRFTHIPDWYAWERECVKKELIDGTYRLDTDVDIYMLVDKKCVYNVGGGHITHDRDGFHLVGCDGKLDFSQKPVASYSLYSDYYWYEIGDMICIGNRSALYYCFPTDKSVSVAKARLAVEELYKLVRKKRTLSVTSN